jgi:hypothetical protein
MDTPDFESARNRRSSAATRRSAPESRLPENSRSSKPTTTTRTSVSTSTSESATKRAALTCASALISAPDAEARVTALKDARSERAREARTPLRAGAWRRRIDELGLATEHGHIPHGIEHGFRLGTDPITTNYHPPNTASADEFADALEEQIANEVLAERYLGPFTAAEVNTALGPFQSSPQSCRPKAGQPGKARLIRNLSFPQHPIQIGIYTITSINSRLSASDHPHSWGSFWTVVCTIVSLPPGSEAASEDVIDAYRSIGIDTQDWPALVVRAPGEDRFYVDTCLCFGAVPGDGLFGEVMDAFLNIARALGFGPSLPWVDDQILFRILVQYLQSYNELRAQQAERIRKLGGLRSKGARRWWAGGTTPSGRVEEFAEDMRFPIRDHSTSTTPRSEHDKRFTYALSDYEALGKELGMLFSPKKRLPFDRRTEFIGLSWDVQAHVVTLLNRKREKYHEAVQLLLAAQAVSKREAESVFGKLHHAALVLPEGRTYLIDLSYDLSNYSSSSFATRHLGCGTRRDLQWWKERLLRPLDPRALPYPTDLWDPRAYSDASSKIGVAIWINGFWRTWRLRRGWESDDRKIAWAEAAGFLLLARAVAAMPGAQGRHVILWGDNRVVVEGWWNSASRNRAVNAIFRQLHSDAPSLGITAHARYVRSAENPADNPSRGVYGRRQHLLPPVELGDLSEFLIDFDDPRADELCLPLAAAASKHRGIDDYAPTHTLDEFETEESINLSELSWAKELVDDDGHQK